MPTTGVDSSSAMTPEQWAAMDEDEPGELVDGHLVDEEVPDFIHEVVVAWFVRVIGTWIVPRGGFAIGSEAKYGVTRSRGRKPDVSVYLPGRRPPARGLIQVPPDVAVEVVSPTARDARRDRIEKADEYAAFGIRHYWIVDPENRTLEMFELGHDQRYVRALGAAVGRLDTVPGCAGLELDLDQLWAEVDRAESSE